MDFCKSVEKFHSFKLIGQGGQGAVYSVVCKKDSTKYALKIVPMTNPTFCHEQMKEEVRILSKLSHPNVLHCYDYFESPTKCFLVMDKLAGKDLFDYIIDHFKSGKERLTETRLVRIVRNLLKPVIFLHENQIAHRDIKSENYMLRSGRDDSDVVLVDFGFAKDLTDVKWDRSSVGTLLYAAPEVFTSVRTKSQIFKCDVYAIGVLCFILMTGREPIYTQDGMRNAVKRIKKGKVAWQVLERSVSPQAVDFVKSLMQLKSADRLTAKEALKHPWMTEHIDHELDNQVMQDLSCFDQHRRFNNAVAKILHQTNFADSWSARNPNGITMKQHFELMDVSNTGTITIEDLKEYLKAEGCPWHMVEDTAGEVLKMHGDADSDVLTFDDFASFWAQMKISREDELHVMMFEQLDQDNNNMICLKDLTHILDEDMAQEIIDVFDYKADGQICFEEWNTVFQASRAKNKRLLATKQKMLGFIDADARRAKTTIFDIQEEPGLTDYCTGCNMM